MSLWDYYNDPARRIPTLETSLRSVENSLREIEEELEAARYKKDWAMEQSLLYEYREYKLMLLKKQAKLKAELYELYGALS